MHIHPADHARLWLQQAASDFAGATGMLDIKHYDLTCFLAQQVADKSLKGLLIWLAGEKPRSHVIAELVREARRLHPFADHEFEEVETLDQYYVATRYPDALGGALPSLAFQRTQSVEALRLARMVLDAASNVVPHSSRESSPLG